jgi:hypothetical protein
MDHHFSFSMFTPMPYTTEPSWLECLSPIVIQLTVFFFQACSPPCLTPQNHLGKNPSHLLKILLYVRSPFNLACSPPVLTPQSSLSIPIGEAQLMGWFAVNAQIFAVFYNPLFSADHRRPRKFRLQNSVS